MKYRIQASELTLGWLLHMDSKW